MDSLFLSCDWGTSSFRLRLVDMRRPLVIEQVTSQYGIATAYNEWKESGVDREEFYLRYLQQNIALLSERTSRALHDTPVVISGMACSSIGIKELAYAPLPFAIEGDDALIHQLETGAGFSNKCWLISGASNGRDVMRGEETQMVGLAALAAEKNDESIIYIFPGTHSKHIRVSAAKIVDFKTYMTGELFNVVKTGSILRDAVQVAELANTESDAFLRAFNLGVARSGADNILNTLFSVRINQLFKYLTREENYFYLSGIFIGTELRSLLRHPDVHIRLCSGSNMFRLYQLAVEKIGLADHTEIISAEIVDHSAVDGQVKIFKKKVRE
jgi:2-dehydro-3-deoxygalactonokinase